MTPRPRRGEDKALPVECMPPGTCSRRLKPGQVKRYTSTGPLIAYVISCPGCGFIENWPDLEGERGFVEDEGKPGKLIGAKRPYECMLCHRTVKLEFGVITATAPPG